MAICTRSSSQNPTTGGGGARAAPLRAEELLAVGCHRGRESHFPFRLWPLGGCPCSRGWSRTQVLMNCANRARLTEREKDMKVAGEHRFRAGLREGGEGIGGEYEQIHCIHTEFLQNDHKM